MSNIRMRYPILVERTREEQCGPSSPKEKQFGRWNAKLNVGEGFPPSLDVKHKELLCTSNPLFLLSYFINSSSSANAN